MADTFFYIPKEKERLLVTPYTLENGNLRTLKNGDNVHSMDFSISQPLDQPQTYFGGDSGIVTTATDLLKFAIMLQNKGIGNRLKFISPKPFHWMTNIVTSKVTTIDIKQGYGYGVGVFVHEDWNKSGKLASVGEFFHCGIFGDCFFVDPMDEFSMVILTQQIPASFELSDKIKVAVYSNFMPFIPASA